jgi:hypothetical protein
MSADGPDDFNPILHRGLPPEWAKAETLLKIDRERAKERASTVKLVVWLVVFLAGAVGWACRWQPVETHVGDRPGDAYAINRWTGSVMFMRNGEVEILTPTTAK